MAKNITLASIVLSLTTALASHYIESRNDETRKKIRNFAIMAGELAHEVQTAIDGEKSSSVISAKFDELAGVTPKNPAQQLALPAPITTASPDVEHHASLIHDYASGEIVKDPSGRFLHVLTDETDSENNVTTVPLSEIDQKYLESVPESQVDMVRAILAHEKQVADDVDSGLVGQTFSPDAEPEQTETPEASAEPATATSRRNGRR